MQRFDVAVIGAGPAGSAAAYHLAAAGATVLVVDRATFPRDKPCGGGLTARAVKHCPIDPAPVVEDAVDTVELRFRYREGVVRRASAPVILMTQRRRLDALLLEAARAVGVDAREGVRVRLEHGLQLNGEPVKADLIVGADGANGVTARAFGLGTGIIRGVAYEGNVSYGQIDRQRYRSRSVIELADIPGGYGWVFPKANHVNVGVGGWQSEGRRLREHLVRLCEAHAVPPEAVTDLKGHRLPLRRPGTRIASQRVLLVGDAAGLVDPVSGDGMYECFVSARLAAAAALDVLSGTAPSLEPYEAAVDAALGSLHRASWKLKIALDRWPRTSWQVARTALLWRSVERLLLGELSAPGEQHGVARLPLRCLDGLARVAAYSGGGHRRTGIE